MPVIPVLGIQEDPWVLLVSWFWRIGELQPGSVRDSVSKSLMASY